MVLAQDVMAYDPIMSRKALAKQSKQLVEADAATSCLEHAMSLPHQGQLFRDTPSDATGMWSVAVEGPSSTATMFILIAASHTTPTSLFGVELG